MPKVAQAHLDARRQQIIDAARSRFASHGFARTSIADIVAESGLSNGAIYRYFESKDEIVIAVCEQVSSALPPDLEAKSVRGFLEHMREMAREHGHARLVAQIYAEAALSASLAALVITQEDALRAKVADLVRTGWGRRRPAAAAIAAAFVALCSAYSQQLAIRGDADPVPFAKALMAILEN